jgi:hypothetical protein
MGIAVTAIAFDHLRGQPGTYTVPLRFTEAQPVPVPEWQRGQATPSVAAYAADRLPAAATVAVRLAVTPDEPRQLQVRAAVQPAAGSPRPLLADLQPRTVTFNAAGDSGWVPFAFDPRGLAAGVDAATAQWTWQVQRAPGGPWLPFDSTQHRVYAVLSEPRAPWLVRPATPANRSLPRADMLEVACAWARGATTVADAAARVTAAVNALGPEVITYDTLVGAPHYSVLGGPRFLCDAFLDRLRGGPGAGPLVNCSDCATIVSSFANLLGADLWQSRMGYLPGGFRLNPILGIGAREWSTLFGGFSFHEVAWTGACAENDLVYDACLHVDQDPNPTAAPHTPLLPAGHRFGTPGSGDYRDRIAAPEGRAACVARPDLRLRRPISGQAFAFAPRLPTDVSLTFAKSARVEETAAVRKAEEVRFDGFGFFGTELPGWALESSAEYDAPAQPRVLLAGLPLEEQIPARSRVVVTLWRSPEQPDALLRLESIETPSSAQARRMLVQVAAEFENPGLEHWDRGVEGETGLRLPNGGLALFTRGNHVHVARSAGREPVDVTAQVETLDRWLMEAGDPAGPQDGWGFTAALPPAAPAVGWKRTHIPAAAEGPSNLRALSATAAPLANEPVRQFVVTPAHAARWNA